MRTTKQTPKEVSLIWEEPTRPNGVIIGYEVRLHPLFHENIDSYPRSISNWVNDKNYFKNKLLIKLSLKIDFAIWLEKIMS